VVMRPIIVMAEIASLAAVHPTKFPAAESPQINPHAALD
jgi:hypothetical protein